MLTGPVVLIQQATYPVIRMQTHYQLNVQAFVLAMETVSRNVMATGLQLILRVGFKVAGISVTGASPGQVPYFPGPPATDDNGACSYNLGYVYTNMTNTVSGDICSNVTQSTNGDIPSLENCECCQISIPLSNALNVCPKSDLSPMGISTAITDVQSALTKIDPFIGDSITDETSNCAILNNASDPCRTDYSFDFLGGQVYNPLSLPSDILGTEPLTNMAGNAFTELSTTLFTLSLEPAYATTITQAPFVAGVGPDTDTAAATAAASASTTSGAVEASVTSSATKSKGDSDAAATATSKSGCEKNGIRSLFMSVSLLLVVGFCMA